jgi:hypothetical protein
MEDKDADKNDMPKLKDPDPGSSAGVVTILPIRRPSQIDRE